MQIIARDQEIKLLKKLLNSEKAEFIAVYGRRRIGKTFLIKNFFLQQSCLFLHITGMEKSITEIQRENFCRRFSEIFHEGLPIKTPKNWREVFSLLNKAINKIPNNKKFVLFLDEFPWMATARSQLLETLEYFWNEYWGNDKRIKLIICGSSASWIIKNIINNTGGLFQRVTQRLKLEPFDLSETKLFLNSRGIKLNNRQITSLYMAVGGIPLYLEQAEKGMTAQQVIDKLCFNKNGLLVDELKELFSSLFKNSAVYINLVKAIAKSRHGIPIHQLAKTLKLSRGGRLTERLTELEDAGFIVSFTPYQYKERGEYYKIIDEYTLFYFNWILPNNSSIKALKTPSGFWLEKTLGGHYQAWKGYAFESICYKHIERIMEKLNLKATSIPYGWRIASDSKSRNQGTQIDLLFDRTDDAITLCEIKYSDKPFAIDKNYAKSLQDKKTIFVKHTATKKQIFIALITASGVKENTYSKQLIDNIVVLDDLF